MSEEEEKYFSLANYVIYVTRLDRRKNLSILEEYFRYNVAIFNTFISEYKMLPTEYDDIFSSMCIFHFDSIDNPYFLQANRDTQDIEYQLTDSIDNPFDMKEVTTFKIEYGKNEGFRKQSFNDTGFFDEEYLPNRYIKTSIYDINAVKDLSFSFEKPIIMDSMRILSVFIEQTVNSEFIIEIRDSIGKLIEPRQTIVGKSLYSAYYDFMIKKGYFHLGSQKNIGEKQ